MSDQFAIIRMTTLKAGDLAGAERHNLRLGEPEPNVDPSRTHLNRYLKTSESTLSQTILNRISDAGVTRKVQTTAILGIELMLTASPEFFDTEMRSGTSKKLDDWVNAQIKYVEKFAGGPENVVQFVLHMDETTPHIQAIFVPISTDAPSKKNLKQEDRKPVLNAKPFTSPGKWQKMWTTYAAAMSPFGLKRGSVNADSEHQTIKAGRKEVINLAKEAIEISRTTSNQVHSTMAKQNVQIDRVVRSQEKLIKEQRTFIEQLQQTNSDLVAMLRKLMGGGGNNVPTQVTGRTNHGKTSNEILHDVFADDGTNIR